MSVARIAQDAPAVVLTTSEAFEGAKTREDRFSGDCACAVDVCPWHGPRSQDSTEPGTELQRPPPSPAARPRLQVHGRGRARYPRVGHEGESATNADALVTNSFAGRRPASESPTNPGRARSNRPLEQTPQAPGTQKHRANKTSPALNHGRRQAGSRATDATRPGVDLGLVANGAPTAPVTRPASPRAQQSNDTANATPAGERRAQWSFPS